MPHSGISLRPATPDPAEGRAFGRYLDQAAEGFFRFWLGGRFEEILATAFVEEKHDLSFENVTFAETDGHLVGMVSGYTAQQHRLSTLRPLERAAGRFPVRMMVVGALCAPMLRIIDTVADGDFYLQSVAIDEGLRGRGIGSLLIDSLERQAVASGATRLVLDVSGSNEAARRLYERRGMTVDGQWPRRLRIPGLSFLRMVKNL